MHDHNHHIDDHEDHHGHYHEHHHHHHAPPPDDRVVHEKLDPNVIDYFKQIPELPYMQRLSALYQRHPMGEMPALARLKSDLAELEESQSGEHPEIPVPLLAYMKHHVDIELRALGKVQNDNEDKHQTRNTLNGLHNYFGTLAAKVEKQPEPETNSKLKKAWHKAGKGYRAVEDFLYDTDHKAALPHAHRLPEEYQHLLKTVKHHTGQSDVTLLNLPVKTLKTAQLLWFKTFEHILEEAKESWGKAAVISTALAGVIWFNQQNLGNANATMYIDPDDLRVNNFSLNALADPDFKPEYTELDINFDEIELPWHDHMSMLVGDDNARWLKENVPGIEKISPKHFSKLLDQATTAQDIMDWFYYNFFTRAMSIIGAPAEDLGNKTLPDSPFKESFIQATNKAEQHIVKYNLLENIIFHSLVFWVAWGMAHKLGSMRNEEVSEHWDLIRNFWHRTRNTSPLTYGAAGTGLGAAIMNHSGSGFDPSMVWMPVLSAIGAETLHTMMRTHNRKDHLEAMNKAMERLKNTDFSQYPQPAEDSITFMNKLGGTLNNKFSLVASGSAATAMILDGALNQWQGTGTTFGHIFVYGPFAAYDVVEDNIWHLFFGGAGAAAGTATGLTHRGARLLGQNAQSAYKKLHVPSSDKPSSEVS